MKSLATIAMTLVITALTSGAALGHPDVIGTPDPSWQNTASPSGDSRSQIAAGGAMHPVLLRAYIYVLGAVFVILILSLLHSLWTSSRRVDS